jgi:stage II sporulation protein P
MNRQKAWEYMGRKFAGTGKIKIITYILMIVLLVRVILWLEPEKLRKQLSLGMADSAQKVVIHILQESNVKVSYLLRDKSGVVDKIAESVNQSNRVYSFVEYHYEKENLVVYAPQEKEAETIRETKAEEAQPEQTQPDTETAAGTETSTQTTLASKTTQTDGTDSYEEEAAETLAPAFSLEQLADYDFVRSNLYVVPERASVLPEDLDTSVLLDMDMTIEKNPDVPQILIYHTHGSETFADSTEDVKNTGIIAAGSVLAQQLSEVYGYNVIHCTEIFDNVNGVFDRSKAYDYSRAAVQQILTDNPEIQVIIDLHRDGVREDLRLVTQVNGKQTAQIMFFNGVSRSSAKGELTYLYNRYRSENLSFSLQAKLEALSKYPDFTRKNYIDAYQYNLDLLPRAMLIEAGAQTNTLEEEKNAMEPLADILDSVLSGKSREHLGIDG